MAEKIVVSANWRQSTSGRILKALSLFGGLQILIIICSVVRNKFIALWLGTAGVGLFALYNYTLELINQLCQLNLRQSAVREIAAADRQDVKAAVGMVRRVSVILGCIGAVATLILSPLLSYWTFGDYSHTYGFAILAIGVGLSVVLSGEQAILQASDRLRLLAKATAIGSITGTAISILLFKLMGIRSIVPSMLAFFITTAFSAVYYGRKSVISATVTSKAALLRSGPMLRLGAYMTAGTAIASLASYIFIAWLRGNAGESGVGVYQAGFVIINQYVGLVFMALGVEYFPRISRVSMSVYRTRIAVRHEILIIMLVMLPASVVFINAAPFIVKLLYSSEFSAIVPYATIAAIGTVFKAFSFAMAYVIIARGDGKIYLLTESVSAAIFIGSSIWGWSLGGYLGLGIAYAVWYGLYAISVSLVCRYRYGIAIHITDCFLPAATLIAAGLQAMLALYGHYSIAIGVSAAAVAASGYMLYRVLKRRTLKE
ncbi:MAG: oligosaccharide flippase family protein [Muribaculaceae bacterium]|nr:oligosaccharide flippase family protein [Muribaculaceae bacterium]